MNERVAAAGNQVKEAFGKLKNAWTELEAARKKLIVIVVAAIVVVAIVVVAVLNGVSSRYVVLYNGLPREESVAGAAALESAGIKSKINDEGELEVPAKKEIEAVGKLAQVGIPGTTVDYSVFEKGGGLTMTDFEKRQYEKYQSEAFISSVIKTFDGVRDAFVSINREDDSNRVWTAGTSNNSASVKVTMEQGTALTASQVSAIRQMVGSGQGIDPEQVTIIDGDNILAAAGTAYSDYDAASTFLQRQGLQEEVEARLRDKTANVLSLAYPDPAEYSITPTVELDWDAMITESMEYFPLEGTQHGVAEFEEEQALMGTGQYAAGVVGETDNTDIPYYTDLDGDGEMDAVDYYRQRQFLVTYVKKQIEKDGAKMESASISVMLSGTVTDEIRQAYRNSISQATGVAVDDISVQSVPKQTITPPGEDEAKGTIISFIPDLYVYIAALALVVLIILLILLIIIRRKIKKKKLAAEAAAMEAEEAEALRIQQEIEERKKQLKNAAMADSGEDAIIEEVRDFARHNPEITATLLRNWLKDGE